MTEFETLAQQYYHAILDANNKGGLAQRGKILQVIALMAARKRDTIKNQILDLAAKVGGDIRERKGS